MENIITSNLNFVKRVITSKVEANKGHTRFVLADKTIKVRSNGKLVDMRYIILTDEKGCLNIKNHNACLSTGSGQFCLKNDEENCGLIKAVRNPETSKALSDKDLRAVPSCLLGPKDSMAPLEDTDNFQTKRVYTIGFDTEWTEGSNGRRHILSYQLSMYVRAGQDAILLEFILFPGGHRITLDRLFTIYTQALRSELNLDIGPTASNYKDPVICYLVAHYSIVDLTTFLNAKEILRGTDTIRRTQSSVEKPLFINVWDKNYHYKQLWVIKVRDTMHLSPAGSSLEKLGNAMGKIKLELPSGYTKERMDILLKQEEDEFMLYASNDATLALDYIRSMYGDNDVPAKMTLEEARKSGEIPVTLGSEGAHLFREKIMGINDWDVKQFDYEFRGLIAVKGDDGRKRLMVRPEAAVAWEMASQAYYGGRNECFLYGIHKSDVWYDYDLSGAYPTAMSLLRNPDFSKVTSLTGDIIKIDPTDYIFGYVEFEFPENVLYPCLPIRDVEGRGLIYPRRGRTYASAPELYVALKLGARLKWVQPGIQVASHEGKFDMRDALMELLKERAEAKKLYGKGSVQEVRLKEIVNSIYGKMAQGLSGKRNYSTRADAVMDLPPSIITQPLIASMTTALVRAIVSAAMHELYLKGYRIASVTTDGFLCDAPPEEVNSLKLFGFRDAYRYVREELVGDPTMWEIKHMSRDLIPFTTRGSIGLNQVNNYPVHIAKAGYKPEPEFYEKFKNKEAEELARRFLMREGKIEMGFNKLPSPKDYVRKNADGLSVFQKKRVEWEYDLKRKPNNMWEDSITIGDKTYKHLCFDTVPWETIDDFVDARAIKKAHPELYPLKDKEKGDMLMAMIRDKEATKKAGMLIQSADKGGIYRTAVISYLRDLLAGREPMPTWMKGKSYRELAEAFNERLKSLNVKLSANDFKKAKQRSNKGKLENSEALEIVKRLLI